MEQNKTLNVKCSKIIIFQFIFLQNLLRLNNVTKSLKSINLETN